MEKIPDKPQREFLTKEEERSVRGADSPEAAHLVIGRRGEELACRYLWRRGFRILERNFRCQSGEIDIIAEKKQCIRFVEVKTRTGDSLAAPEERVDAAKRERLRRVAREYLDHFRDPPRGGSQFDVLAQVVNSEGRPVRQNFIENAF